MSHRLTDEAMAIEHALITHIRLVSYDPARPHHCACGWTGSGTKGNTLNRHIARKAAAAVAAIKRGPTCDSPSIHAIEVHRAIGEQLCEACSLLLRGLA